MDQITSERITSLALSANYPAFYYEFQVRNWSHVDIVVTDFKGEQHLVAANADLRESEACVEVECRSCSDRRSELTEYGLRDVAIPGTRTIIPFDHIRNSPYRDTDHNVIISTVDQAVIAKQMISEHDLNPMVYETRADEEILDPRFVLQVVDPCNQWDVIYVNMFGQTAIVRAGHWAKELGTEEQPDADKPIDKGKLICYLRYPFDYYSDSRPLSTIFEVSLDDIEKNEPIRLPNGDVICVAATESGLQQALAKKASGNNGRAISNQLSERMVSKDLYNAAQKAHEDEIKRLQEESKAKLETLKVSKDNEISKLKFDLNKSEQERDTFKMKYEQLNSLVDIHSKAVKDSAEAKNKRMSVFVEAIKVIGGIAVPVILALAKSKK